MGLAEHTNKKPDAMAGLLCRVALKAKHRAMKTGVYPRGKLISHFFQTATRETWTADRLASGKKAPYLCH